MSLPITSFQNENVPLVYGLLITRDDHQIFSEWCDSELHFYEHVVCLDGSESRETAEIAKKYQKKLLYFHEREFDIPHKTDHGLRHIAHTIIQDQFGPDHWIMCCHTDEFCYHDPRKIARLAQSYGADQVAWYSPHFYPHPDDLRDWEQRRLLPITERFRHYHWDYFDSGFPWVEDRLYKASQFVHWDSKLHGSVRPNGLRQSAPFHPILRHYKVVIDDTAWYDTTNTSAHYRHHWPGQVHRTGLPFSVTKFEDFFVTSIPKYHRCDHFLNHFTHPWNIGDEWCPHRFNDDSEAIWERYRIASRQASKSDSTALKELSIIPISDKPLQALIQNDLATIHAINGDIISAIKGFQAAIWLDPKCQAAHKNLKLLEHEPISSGGHASDMPKIAVLSFLFNWPSSGGGIVHTLELCKFLIEAGYDVCHIYARYQPWGIGEVLNDLPYPNVELEFVSSDWSAELVRKRFKQALDQFQPDHVIITDSWNIKPLLAEAASGYPYVLRLQALECVCPLNNVRLIPGPGGSHRQCPLHQLATPDRCKDCVQQRGHLSGQLHKVERAFSGFHEDDYPQRLAAAFAQAEVVLVVNPLAQAMLSPFAKEVRVVTAGMDPARFPWPPKADARRQNGILSILFAGIPEEWMKGFHILLQAAWILWKKRNDFQILATGDPPDSPEPFTQYIGWQSQDDLPNYLQSCDLLVMPTIAQEALGRTAVEAMASGKPVVASRIGGLPFTVLDGATGLLCEPGNPADLANKIEILLDSRQLRERFGLAGRARFEEHYAWPVIIEKHYRALFPINTIAPLTPKMGQMMKF
jgi:glycosyltransferase involved in cell wall biosynthesis